MIKSVFQKINFVIKAIIFYLLLLTVVCSFIYFLIYTFQEFLVSQFRYDVSKQSILHLLPFSYYLSGWAIFTLLYLFFTYDIRSFYRKVQNITLDSLSDRKLPDDFPLYKSTYTFEGISTHLHSILSLYKSFDNMKTARIMLEVNSVKQLMNVVDEGVLLINADRVVTHINHNGEQLLRLIPGEIIGEAISRKISNELFLQNLDQTLEFDQKIIGKKITFGDKNILLISMFPVKDKFGDVVRALVVIRKNTVVSSVNKVKKTKHTKKEMEENNEEDLEDEIINEEEDNNMITSMEKT